jgi:hypothetical protein
VRNHYISFFAFFAFVVLNSEYSFLNRKGAEGEKGRKTEGFGHKKLIRLIRLRGFLS